MVEMVLWQIVGIPAVCGEWSYPVRGGVVPGSNTPVPAHATDIFYFNFIRHSFM
jgi:hypothetical protein